MNKYLSYNKQNFIKGEHMIPVMAAIAVGKDHKVLFVMVMGALGDHQWFGHKTEGLQTKTRLPKTAQTSLKWR